MAGEEEEQDDRGEFAERGAGDRELADWVVGHPRILQDGNDQAQRRGEENDPHKQRAFDQTCGVKHDTDDQSEQCAQAEREPGQVGAGPAKVADVDLQAGEEEQERQPDGRHQPYHLVRFDQVQYGGAQHDPGDDLEHRPGTRTRGTAARTSSGTTAATASTGDEISMMGIPSPHRAPAAPGRRAR